MLLAACAGPTLRDTPDAPFIPTPAAVVEEMLDLAAVKPADVLYDLGSGDGRIVIAAARRGARAVGIEIDAQLVQDSRDRAFAAGFGERTTFLWQDALKADLGAATVVTLYLFPEINAKLAPKFLAELRPGTRVVSHRFPVGDWAASRILAPEGTKRPYPVYFYVIPAR